MKFFQVLTICVVVLYLTTVSESRSIAKRSNSNIIYENCIKDAEQRNADCYADIPWLSNEMHDNVKTAMNAACKTKYDKDAADCVETHLASLKYEHD